MVNAKDFRTSSLGLSPGQGNALYSWRRNSTLTASLFSQMNKWVPVNLLLEGNPVMD